MEINKNKLKILVSQGESEILEFKKSTGLLSAAFETVCAFLNGRGGTVLIGIGEGGKIIGQDVTDKTRQEIAGHVLKLEPTAQAPLRIEYVPVEDGRYVVAITVTAGKHVPYVYDARPFIRNQSTTNRMTQHRYEQLIIERGQLNHSWDEQPVIGYGINDLDHEEIYKTLTDGVRENRIPASIQKEDVSEILSRLGLFVDDKLNRAAVVLYAKESSLRFSQCMIKMARFKGINKLGDFIDNQQIKGNAFRLLSEADAFFRRHLPIASFFNPNKFKRIDKPALPVMAIREALINSVCHRNYADKGTDISVAIFDDKVEIWNSGTLPSKISLQDLKRKHESVLRNELIANVFYVRGLIEKWGIGTNKMVDLCKEGGLPEPEFEERTGGIAVTFKFAEPIGVIAKKSEVTSSIKLSTRQTDILKIIQKHQSVNIQQIMLELENPPSQRMVKKDLNYLKSNGFIVLKKAARNSLWAIK